MANNSKLIDKDTDNVSYWCVYFIQEKLIYPFWRAMEDDVFLLVGPQDLHTSHGLAFMEGMWWNFYVNG